MASIWQSFGFMRLPVALCVALVLAIGFGLALKLFRPDASPALRTKAWIDALLGIGVLGLIGGLLGVIQGIIVMFQAFEAAGSIGMTPAVARGLRIALLSPALGTSALGLALVCWVPLNLRWRLLRADVEVGEP